MSATLATAHVTTLDGEPILHARGRRSEAAGSCEAGGTDWPIDVLEVPSLKLAEANGGK